MEIQYCWRCKVDIPMLTDKEFEFVCTIDRKPCSKTLFHNFLQLNNIENHVELKNLTKIQENFKYMIESYRVITGMLELNQNAIFHHQLSQFGPPCPNCKKPLRTKLARYCASCGFGKEDFIERDTLPLINRRAHLFKDLSYQSTFVFPTDKITIDPILKVSWWDKFMGIFKTRI